MSLAHREIGQFIDALEARIAELEGALEAAIIWGQEHLPARSDLRGSFPFHDLNVVLTKKEPA